MVQLLLSFINNFALITVFLHPPRSLTTSTWSTRPQLLKATVVTCYNYCYKQQLNHTYLSIFHFQVSDHQHMVHKAIFDAATEAVLLHQAKALPGRYPRGVMGDRVTPVAVRGVVGGVGVGVGLAGGVGASAGAGMGGGASGAASGAMDDADTTTATGAGVGVGASMSAGAGVGASAGVGSGVLAMARETVLGWARQGAAFPDMFAPAGSGEWGWGWVGLMGVAWGWQRGWQRGWDWEWQWGWQWGWEWVG